MIRRFFLSIVVVTSVIAAGCAPRFDVFTAWTIEGFPAADACQAFDGGDVHFRLEQRDAANGASAEELVHVECALGEAKLSVASFSDVFVDLLDVTETVYGTAGPFALAPALANQGYDGDEAGEPLRFDIDLERGRLRAVFTVVGQDCTTAGASSFTVSVSHNTSPLQEDLIVENQTVTCGAEGAVFELAPVEIGSRYAISATTTIGGETFSTETQGEGVVPSLPLNIVTVDLDTTTRP